MAERRQVLIDLVTNTAPASRGISQTSTQLTGLSRSAGGAKAGLMGVSSGAAVATAGVAAVGLAASKGIQAYGAFDDKLNQSVAIMGDVSDAMRGDMSDAARQVAKETRISAEDAAESYFFLASAGLDAEQSIAALPQVAAFAQAGMFDMARATDLATDAQSALGLTVPDATRNLENMTRVTDVLVKANTLANASVEQFSTSLTQKAGTALRNVNKDIEEGVAVLAVYADQGIKSERAGTILRATLDGLSKNARDNNEEFQALGISVFDSQGEMRNMADIAADLEAALGPMSAQQRDAALAQLGFNRRTREGILALIGNSDAIREYEGELRQAGGTTQDVADNQLDSFQAKMDLAKSRVTDAAIGFGETLAPAVAEGATQLANFVEAASMLTPVAGVLGQVAEAGLKLNFWGEPLQLIRGLFDENVRAANGFDDVVEQLNSRIEDGAAVSDEYNNGLRTLADAGYLTRDSVSDLGDALDLNSDQTLEGIQTALEWARANGVAADQIALLKDGLRESIDASDLDEDAKRALKEEHGLLASEMTGAERAARGLAGATEETGDAASDAARGIEDEADAATGLEGALDDARDAQESLANTMREFADPTFAAFRSLEQLQEAEAKVAELAAEGKRGTDEFAAAELELAQAVLEAQGSLDEFSAQGVEDQVSVIAQALGKSEDEARELLEALGLLDGKKVSTVLETRFTTVGRAPASSIAGTDIGAAFRQHGGPLGAGQPAIVGEGGRELFIPETAGTVVPHGDTERIIAAMSGGLAKTSRTYSPTINLTSPERDAFEKTRQALAFDSLGNF
ncbi:MAG: phage tail tape measure protein [Actinomycetota bacterium]